MISKALFVTAAAVLGILGAGSTAAQAAGQRVPFTPPSAAAQMFTGPAATINDRVIEGDVPATGKLEKAAAAVSLPDGDGHFINVSVSSGYLPSPAANLALAQFFGSLLHGGEMSKLNVYVATPAEMPKLCGADAAACYYSDRDKLIIVGESTFGGLPTDYVAAHEYGHHVANHRRNDPSWAIDTGPKQWATYEGVCPNTRRGLYFPGNEGKHYFENPGEAFAEAYAKYDSRYRGFPWDWTAALTPDANSYNAIRDDVVSPWDGNSSTEYSGQVRRGRSFTRSFKTPLDGGLSLKLRAPGTTDFDLFLRDRNGRVLRQSATKGSRENIRFTVCGQSRLKLTVYSYSGSGLARVAVSKP